MGKLIWTPAYPVIADFVRTAKANGLGYAGEIYVADRAAADRLGVKHLRGGQVPRRTPGAGIPVAAVCWDELGNTVALTASGKVVQFI